MSLSSSILSTLAYHSLFDYPPTASQVHELLISARTAKRAVVEDTLSQLVKSRKLRYKGQYYCLPGLLSPRALALRQRRQLPSSQKLKLAGRVGRLLSVIPWVSMVAVTGALAVKNCDQDDDIDLMIITAANRLWLIRPLVVLLVSIFFRLRRPCPHKSSTHNNEICLNLWLDESALTIPPAQQDLYTAHELAQMKPLVNKVYTYERMMKENQWGKKYLANIWEEFTGYQVKRLKVKGSANLQPVNLFSFFNLLNAVAYHLQRWYMRPKITTERVSLHAAFFHPGHRAQKILKSFSLIIRQRPLA